MRKWVIAVLLLLVLGFIGMGVANLYFGKGEHPALVDASAAPPLLRNVAEILAGKCGDCHTPNAELPLYASLPIASQLIQSDIRAGREAMDFADEFAGVPPRFVREVALAKLENTLRKQMMPPFRYLALHWRNKLTQPETGIILSWIRISRRDGYSDPKLPADLRVNAVRPIPAAPALDARKVALGRALFHDKRLSKDDTISCATCHALDMGGTDREAFSTGVGGQKGGVNAPTVYNSSLSFVQFWDGRAADLREQAGGPVQNPVEMASTWPGVFSKLSKDKAFMKSYAAIYGSELTDVNLRDAIATFEETLLTPDSSFDRYLKGEKLALHPTAETGYRLFVSAGCQTCHVGPAMGGQSFEKMSRDGDYYADRGGLRMDSDSGRFNVTKREQDRHKFKVPTLRNIAKTSPYFHDGTKQTLADAVKAMGKYQLERNFTSTELTQLVAFLESLTGVYEGKPVQ